jgi:hypothetical protein
MSAVVSVLDPSGNDYFIRYQLPLLTSGRPCFLRSNAYHRGSVDYEMEEARCLDSALRQALSEGHTRVAEIRPGTSWSGDPITALGKLMDTHRVPVVCANSRLESVDIYSHPWELVMHSPFDRDVFESRLRERPVVPVKASRGGLSLVDIHDFSDLTSHGQPAHWALCGDGALIASKILVNYRPPTGCRRGSERPPGSKSGRSRSGCQS